MKETLVTGLEKTRRLLDKFNLEVAEFRLKDGHSQGLINLYAMMGRFDNALRESIKNAQGIEDTFQRIQE